MLTNIKENAYIFKQINNIMGNTNSQLNDYSKVNNININNN